MAKQQETTNEIFIGKKPFMRYIQSLEHLFLRKGVKKVVLKARGRSISTAVDLAVSAKNKFLKNLNLSIADVQINSEEAKKIVDGQETDQIIYVSCIEITLQK